MNGKALHFLYRVLLKPIFNYKYINQIKSNNCIIINFQAHRVKRDLVIANWPAVL